MLKRLVESFDVFVQSRAARILGYLWLAAASLTWMLCPSPAPPPAKTAPAVHYANAAGYLVECLSLWPLIAYSTLDNARRNSRTSRA